MRFTATLLACSALFAQLGLAHDLRDEARQKRHHDAAKAKIEKRYPPGRETFIPTTTPAYALETTSATPAATKTSSSTSSGSQTTPPPGQYTTGTTRVHVAATTTTPTTCAPPYIATSMILGTGTLPKPTSFVTKVYRSNQLTLNGSPFTIVGPNIFWLCQGQDYGPLGSYTDKSMVREALAIAIRALSCGISTGTYNNLNPYNLEPAFNSFDSAAWDIRDYVLYAAREYGLRVILTLTDNYAYYHGGKYDFLNWRRASLANNGADFYINRAVMAAYNSYITYFITHVNSYTGVAYYNDPTIIAWETGYINAEVWPPYSWTKFIIQTIRKYDINHLIIDGTNGFWNYTTGATSAGLTLSGVDMVTDHGYPRNTGIISKEYSLMKPALKNFLIGEFDWTTTYSSTDLATYLNLIESWKPLVGDDGYSIYYPNGNSLPDEANVLLLAQHWHRMTNRTPPTSLVGVACPQPVF
ncbi:glycoside hydrolase [Rhodotorula toruloides]|uniref:mannan endo-1,4-beta-mannosidase n=1 Tax=Rhodotorula toruloides TaxID=5286 RepID=A0A511KLA2_RHOTO|nr:glycoside hydrolase [Rhodotorula toruloides]